MEDILCFVGLFLCVIGRWLVAKDFNQYMYRTPVAEAEGDNSN